MCYSMEKLEQRTNESNDSNETLNIMAFIVHTAQAVLCVNYHLILLSFFKKTLNIHELWITFYTVNETSREKKDLHLRIH